MNDIVLNILLIIAYAIFIFVGMEWFRARRLRKGNVIFLTAEEFQKEAKGGQIIDVREKEEFDKSHISGSRNFNLKAIKRSTSAIRKDQVQYVYGKNAKSATKVANELYRLGFPKLVVMKANFEDYKGKTKSK